MPPRIVVRQPRCEEEGVSQRRSMETRNGTAGERFALARVADMKNIHLDDRDIQTLSKALKAYAATGENEAVERILAKVAEATDDEITEATLLIG